MTPINKCALISQMMALPEIHDAAKVIFAGLMNYLNVSTGQWNPKQTTLAKKLNRSRDSVGRGLRQLRDAGIITVDRRQRGCCYKLNLTDEGKLPTPLPRRKPPERETAGPPAAVVQPTPPEEASAHIRNETETSSSHIRTSADRTSEAPPSLYEPLIDEPITAGGEGAVKATGVVGPAQPTEKTGSLFPPFWQLFVKGGVALNERDKASCQRLFESLPLEEQRRAGRWVINQFMTVWRRPEWTAHPLNVLREQRWTRVAEDRTIPKPQSEFDRALEEMCARRRAKGAAA